MSWGGWERGCRLGVFLNEGGSATRRTVKADIYFESQVRIDDSHNSLRWDGWVSGSKTPGMVRRGSGQVLIHHLEWGVDTAYGVSQQVELGAALTGLEYVPDGRLDGWDAVTVPARPYERPARPPACWTERRSDRQLVVTWSTDYTGSTGPRPWSQVEVERWDQWLDDWRRVETVGWDTTSYSDGSVIADRIYMYRVRSLNPSGASDWTYGPDIYQTPAAHTQLTWAKDGGDVVLSWVQVSTMSPSTEIQESTDGGETWAALASVPAGTTSWRHVSPSTLVTHRYRVRPQRGGRTGEWIASSVVQLLTPPLAPTKLAPASLTVDNAAGPVVLSWQHNPLDGTTQTAYELRYRIRPSTAWVTLTGAAVSSREISAGTWASGLAIEWQVRTRGQHPDLGPWSALALVQTGTRPTATIQTPPEGETIGTPEMPIMWAYFDAEGTAQAGAEVEMLDAGEVVWARSVQGTGVSVMPPPVTNGRTLTIRVRVLDGSGLWSAWTSRTVTVDFVPPPTPTGVVVWDDDLGSALITISNPISGEGEVDAQTNQVWRSLDAGVTWVLVADHVPIGGAVSDRAALAAGRSLYRIVAVSATPTTAASAPVILDAHTCWVWVSGGSGLDVIARVRGDAQVSSTRGRPKKHHRFVGDAYKTEFIAPTAREVDWALSGKVAARPEDSARAALWGSWPAWDAVADLPAPLLFRDPLGRRAWVSISDVKIDTPPGERFASVSCSLTRVGGRD